MREIEDLSAEGNKTIRVIELENGQKAYLRFYFHGGWKDSPGEAEISAAFKRLVSKSLRSVSLPDMANGIFTGRGSEYKRISSDKKYPLVND